MATESELLELTKEKLADIILKLRSDDDTLRAMNDASKTQILALKTKLNEMTVELKTGAQRITRFKELQESKDEVERQNQQLAKKVSELEILNENIKETVPIMKEELDNTKKRLQDELREVAIKGQALLEVRAAKKQEMEECSNNKEKIRSRMESSIDNLNKRIVEYKEKETKKKLIIDKFEVVISGLRNDIMGLKQMEIDQRKQIMANNQLHDDESKKQRLVEKTLRDQCDQVKAENVLLKERLESTQSALDNFTKLAKPSDKPRPRSPVGQTKAQEEEGKKPCTFAKIGGKCSSGRKSPLNPDRLARKLKYRF